MNITMKQINAELPSVNHFRRWYFPHHYAGIARDDQQLLERVVFRVSDDGSVSARDYGAGDAMEPDDYRMRGCCVDVVDIISDWAFDGCACPRREDVVREIASRLRDKLSE